jgi:GNAT superfamily N-acetyltransferase
VKMKIRKAAPADHADLTGLRALMLEYAFKVELSSQELERMDEFFLNWDGEEPLCMVAEVEGKVVGCVGASFYQAFPSPKNPSGLDAVLHSFAVYEEHRGKGIGRKLFTRILKECRERGVGRIALYATDMGQPIYESFGFSHEVIICPEMRLYHRDLMGLNL